MRKTIVAIVALFVAIVALFVVVADAPEMCLAGFVTLKGLALIALCLSSRALGRLMPDEEV